MVTPILWQGPLLGGLLIGAAATLLLAVPGRVLGVSGIFASLWQAEERRQPWRWGFMLGLLSGGLLLQYLAPELLGASTKPTAQLVLAGLLVGAGSQLGSGCTSGHGVCGLSRLSPRSLLATPIFMAAGFLVASWGSAL